MKKWNVLVILGMLFCLGSSGYRLYKFFQKEIKSEKVAH